MEIGTGPRVWVVSGGPAVDYIAELVAKTPGVRVALRERYSDLQLLRLER